MSDELWEETLIFASLRISQHIFTNVIFLKTFGPKNEKKRFLNEIQSIVGFCNFNHTFKLHIFRLKKNITQRFKK